MRTSFVEKSLNFAKWFRDMPLTVVEFVEDKDTLTKECRWYIIGKYCEMEKYNRKNNESVQELFARLGQDIGCSEPTIRRFVSYFKAIDYLQTEVPDVVSDILSGKLRMSVENVRNLANRPHAEIRKIVERVKSGEERLYEIFPERAVKPKNELLDRRRRNPARATVKDTPKYDPDAQITGLTYTIPSWVGAIDRVFMGDNINAVSRPARKKLIKELSSLKDATDLIMELLLEQDCGKGRV